MAENEDIREAAENETTGEAESPKIETQPEQETPPAEGAPPEPQEAPAEVSAEGEATGAAPEPGAEEVEAAPEASAEETEAAPEAGAEEAEAAPEAGAEEAEAAPEAGAEETQAAPEAGAEETEAAPEAGTEETEPAPKTGAEGEAPEGAARAAPEGVKLRRNKKNLYASDVQTGQAVEGLFLVRRKQIPVDRTGNPFLALTLVDRTGRLEGRLWDNAEQVATRFREGDHVRIKGQATHFQGRLQLRLEEVEVVDVSKLGLHSSEFLQESHSPVDRMFAEVVEIVNGVEDAQLRTLLHGFLDDPEQVAKFKRAPAAQVVHHAWVGGLLEHTLSTMRLGLRLCDHYPHVNRDMVIAGCLLHDYGKIEELAYENAFSYTDQGRLVGHLVMCSQWIYERAAALPGFPDHLRDQLVHIVVSHHGELEFGSPKRPKTLEALLVHYADVLDARVSSFTELLEEVGPDGWTDYSRVYDRPLFRAEAGGAAGPKRPAKRRKRKKRKRPEGEAGPEATSAAPREAREPREPGPPRERRENQERRPPREARGPRPPRGEPRPPRAPREGGPETREPRPPREPREPREGREPRERGGAKPAPQKGLTFNPFATLVEKNESPAPEPPPQTPPESPEGTGEE